mmetsp:Transcript_14037/g.13646  ORF Transcript_14037/g.13646 Transcript_14037/m.13646 type:complete len:98 (-) Transcript_14037:681-974(-)
MGSDLMSRSFFYGIYKLKTCQNELCPRCSLVRRSEVDTHESHLVQGCAQANCSIRTLKVKEILAYRLAIMDTLQILPTYLASGRMVPLSKLGTDTIK